MKDKTNSLFQTEDWNRLLSFSCLGIYSAAVCFGFVASDFGFRSACLARGKSESGEEDSPAKHAKMILEFFRDRSRKLCALAGENED
jgi:hypothetical protein